MYEQKKLSSNLINCIWRAQATEDGIYTDAANEFWAIGFDKHTDDSFSVTLFGPSLSPRTLNGYKGEEYWGIEFHTHVALCGTHKGDTLDAVMPLRVEGRSFWIGTHQYALPAYNDLEAFAKRLEEDGVISSDERIYQLLCGADVSISERSRQRRFRSVAGLTKKQIEQLRRARQAFYLLQQGGNSTDVALAAGYADQSHMIRALRMLRGETPAQIIAAHLRKDS